MDTKIIFPALVISKTFIDKLNYRYLVGDRRMTSQAYRDVSIIDSEGNCFEVERVEQESGRLDWYYSIKLVGLIVRYKPILKTPVYKLSVEDMKQRLITVIGLHKRRFANYGGGNFFIEEIQNCATCPEIIKLF